MYVCICIYPLHAVFVNSAITDAQCVILLFSTIAIFHHHHHHHHHLAFWLQYHFLTVPMMMLPEGVLAFLVPPQPDQARMLKHHYHLLYPFIIIFIILSCDSGPLRFADAATHQDDGDRCNHTYHIKHITFSNIDTYIHTNPEKSNH